MENPEPETSVVVGLNIEEIFSQALREVMAEHGHDVKIEVIPDPPVKVADGSWIQIVDESGE